ncbi:recombinase RecA [Candidatus Poribacteria bacterium]|nr:MAG: recombinase RecA [Candidatus Poribacteria bacterium]
MEMDKEKALESAIAQIKKQFGEGAIMRLRGDQVVPVETIPTGSLALDMALGVGGIPRGRITEIYGQEASGKTTLCLHIIAEAQKRGGIAAFIDAENALDPIYAQRIGVDLENLLISQPDYGEQALEIVETLVRSSVVDVIVIDSVAALVPRAELEGDMGDAHVGLQARLMSQALRKLTAAVNKTRTCVIFTNQMREKIGVMFGTPETTTGGRALKYYASVRIELRTKEQLRSGQEVIGRRIEARVTKNKVAPPFTSAEFELIFGEGISREADLLDLGVQTGLIQKSGSWYAYGDVRLGQGRENAKQYLRDHPEIADEIESKLREMISAKRVVTAEAAPEEQEEEVEVTES